MAAAVEDAIAERDALVVEAGTGTGKTFAYLVPALLSGRRVIVSTGTKNLQDQLYQRDLPRVTSALGVHFKTALLKGRANYVCLHRLQQAGHDGRLASRTEVADLARVRASLWPACHAIGLYRSSARGLFRRGVSGGASLGPRLAFEGVLLAARSRAEVLSPEVTATKFDANAAIFAWSRTADFSSTFIATGSGEQPVER